MRILRGQGRGLLVSSQAPKDLQNTPEPCYYPGLVP